MQDLAVFTSQLTRQFGAHVAVDHIDLSVRRGEIHGLLGHNGAGKTTAVRLLNGVLRADGGEMRVLGLDPGTQGDALRQRTGVLTETPSLEDRLSARENLELFADLYGVPLPEVGARIRQMLEAFGLAEAADLRVGTFSKGMKQRLALVRAMLHAPELLFLDEPISGLDPVSARAVNAAVLRLAREEGRTVVLCTHDLGEAQALCDRVSILRQGRVVASGTQAELSAGLGLTQRLTLEVHPAQVGRLREVLQDRFGRQGTVREAHLELGDVRREDVPHILSAVLSEGIDVFAAVPHAPTLEDVYFRLHDLGAGKVSA